MQLAKVLAWQCRGIRHGSRRLHIRAQAPVYVKKGQHSIAEQPVHVADYVAAHCPSCQQRLNSRSSKTSGPLGKLEQHLKRCCPDLIDWQQWPTAIEGAATLEELLQHARQQELCLRQDSLRIAYCEQDADGQPVLRDAAQVAAIMQLPESRVHALMRLGKKDIPLVADAEPVDILYEDQWLVAVNAPPGVPSGPKHRFMGGSMVNRLIHYLGFPPLPVHRLDMNTSGVLVLAKDSASAADLHAQFRRRTVRKAYLALVGGVPDQMHFSSHMPIGQHPLKKVARTVTPDGQAARTDFVTISSCVDADLSEGQPGFAACPGTHQGASLICCQPFTGRTHQIRVHSAHLGFPMLGDEWYGIKGPWIGRQALHAGSLQIFHPATKEALTVTAPLPEDMHLAAKALGLDTELSTPLLDLIKND